MIKDCSKFGWLFILSLCLLAGPVLGQTAQDFIKSGDEFYNQWDDQKALDEYLKALQLEPQNYEALWKTSRSYTDLADVITGQGKEADARKFDLYAKGETYARRAKAVNPNDTWGHFSCQLLWAKRFCFKVKKSKLTLPKPSELKLTGRLNSIRIMTWLIMLSAAGIAGWLKLAGRKELSAA